MIEAQAPVICGDILASCVCYKAHDHDAEHVCRCGSSWDADYVPLTFPGGGSFSDIFDPDYIVRIAGAWPEPEKVGDK